jgi:hypothetical protein
MRSSWPERALDRVMGFAILPLLFGERLSKPVRACCLLAVVPWFVLLGGPAILLAGFPLVVVGFVLSYLNEGR